MGKITKPVINLDCLPQEPVLYTITTQYNCEESYIRHMVEGWKGNMLDEVIVDWFAPVKTTTKTTITKTGKESVRVVKEKIYPNYAFVKAIMSEQVWDYLRTRNGVSTILAPGGTPPFMYDEEVEKMREQCK